MMNVPPATSKTANFFVAFVLIDILILRFRGSYKYLSDSADNRNNPGLYLKRDSMHNAIRSRMSAKITSQSREKELY
jgi:hypothetical protein